MIPRIRMNWREEYARSLMTWGNLALVGLFFNGILNPNTHWWHYVRGFAWYGMCICDKLAIRA